MTVKSSEKIKRSEDQEIAYTAATDDMTQARPKLFGKARTVSAEEMAAAEPCETDSLLHHSHDLVSQLREAVGRPRLDLS
jgi:hypothetical protein